MSWAKKKNFLKGVSRPENRTEKENFKVVVKSIESRDLDMSRDLDTIRLSSLRNGYLVFL